MVYYSFISYYFSKEIVILIILFHTCGPISFPCLSSNPSCQSFNTISPIRRQIIWDHQFRIRRQAFKSTSIYFVEVLCDHNNISTVLIFIYPCFKIFGFDCSWWREIQTSSSDVLNVCSVVFIFFFYKKTLWRYRCWKTISLWGYHHLRSQYWHDL